MGWRRYWPLRALLIIHAATRIHWSQLVEANRRLNTCYVWQCCRVVDHLRLFVKVRGEDPRMPPYASYLRFPQTTWQAT